MSEFEFQRRLRGLNVPQPPQADLWPAIAARIGAEAARPAAPRRRAWLPLAAAAGLLLAVTAGTVTLGLHEQRAAAPLADTHALLPTALHASRDATRAPDGDPRLLGAAIVLDAAQTELEQALEERPDAVFLVNLLNRTHARRMKLEQLGVRAG
ncbi:MAG: hypothetical protein GXC76_11265 [Rhodanobacteraceae bacterium]|nr:hypothetical protein [Rhodanobacteraceae bacterium]